MGAGTTRGTSGTTATSATATCSWGSVSRGVWDSYRGESARCRSTPPPTLPPTASTDPTFPLVQT